MDEQTTFLEGYKHRIEALTENDVDVFDHVEAISIDSVRCGAYVCLLCKQGKASCRIGDKEYTVERGDIFLGHPNQFLENAMASLDFQFVGLIMSPAFFESILMLGGIGATYFFIRDNPVVHLDEADSQMMITDYEFLKMKLQTKGASHFKESIRLLIQSMVYEFYDCLEKIFNPSASSYTSSETLFHRFMNLALKETPMHRDVRYYADQLCITPKYLSAVCKQSSGQTASTILGNLTTEYVRRELRTTRKTIKEIATAAGFDNLSFFGKYVRRELGMSPRDFRKANV